MPRGIHYHTFAQQHCEPMQTEVHRSVQYISGQKKTHNDEIAGPIERQKNQYRVHKSLPV